jgi:hypothetical protein
LNCQGPPTGDLSSELNEVFGHSSQFFFPLPPIR